MQIGISTSTSGQLAGPATLRAIAAAAGQLGYASVWFGNDSLVSADPGDPGRALPGLDPGGVDPVATLAASTSMTEAVRVGAALRVEPWHRPDVVARSMLALDAMSGGRLTVGLGADGPHRVTQLESVLDALGELAGQERQPAVLLSAADLTGLEHLAGQAAGWHARGVRLDRIAAEADRMRELRWARGAGPALVVPAAVVLTEYPLSWSRAPYRGDLEQVTADLDIVRRAGADEVILGIDGDAGLDQALDVFARVAEALEQRLPSA